MTPEDFTFVARLLKDQTGLVLTRDKAYLVENRLQSVVREHRFADLAELMSEVRGGNPAAITDLIDAMMSKETGFFRDWKPFKHLAEVVLPNLRRARLSKRSFRILCAGCGSGQEVYSVAMQILEEAQHFAGWRVEIVGVDISASAITSAERGVYNQFEAQRGLPIRRLLRHFTKDGSGWRINDNLRRMVSFRVWNILEDMVPLGRFDIVLCRNVLIAFDQQTKVATLQKLARQLTDDGVLYVGVNESVTGVSGAFRVIASNLGIYAAQREGLQPSHSMAAHL